MILLTYGENYKIKIKIEGYAWLFIPKFTNKEFKFNFCLNRSSLILTIKSQD